MTEMWLAVLAGLAVGLALEVGNGNGGGHGFAQALNVLRRGTPEEKRRAIELFADIGDMQVVPALQQTLHDEDGSVREAAQQAMWTIWLRSGDDEIDTLMHEGIHCMERGQYAEAIAIFDVMIDRAPQFAEGYNKRATVYYLMEQFERSIADIHRTLELNPLHFGALSGMGLCYLGLDEPRQALAWFERAVAVNPNMETIQAYIRQIRDFLDE
jgi:tetratricopeptide (TPR) repeat protein